jgi:AcrR family transcriptional regulator
MTDPLFDTLFRPTTLSPMVASAAPVREKGTRTRAGNAMNRTRAALLSGAAQAVSASGTKITMAQVAAAGGVAKATLYNHFRTREAVLAALVVDQVDAIVGRHAERPLAEALIGAATDLAHNPVLRALATLEPGVLAALGRIDLASTGWQHARAAVSELLAREGRGGERLVLRWLASFVVTPAEPPEIAADVDLLIGALPQRSTSEVARPA